MTDSSTKQLHVFVHTGADAAAMVGDVADEIYTQQGTTDHFVVSYAQSLGANGPTLADAVLATCEADYAQLQAWFGNIAIGSLPFQVFIKPGTGGASHANCAATAMFCDAFNGTDSDLARSLVVAEADEVFMANQATGWDCGASNGEALSRILAAAIYPAELSPPGIGGTFASASQWLDSDRPDFVNNTDPTDRNFVSIGCGTLFINWLRFQLGFSLDQVVQAGGTTLAQNFQTLTGQPDGWSGFKDLLDWYFVAGVPATLANDNPFPLEDLAMLEDGVGGQIAVTHQTTMDQLDAFVVDANGALTVRWVTDEGAWAGPATLTGNGFAPPGARVAAAHQTTMHQLDVFVVDANGALNVLWVTDEGAWAGPATLTGNGFAPAGAGVAAAHQTSMHQLDAFVVDANGALNVLWVTDEGAWSDPAALSGNGFAAPGASVAATHQTSMHQLDAFVLDANWALNVLWVTDEGAWSGPAPL